MKTFYITTTLPYVNADPHIGFAFELISADIIARYKRLSGDEVFFNTGTDEHGTKVWEKAKEEGKDTQTYVDEYAEKFKKLREPLGLLPDVNFIRTTDSHHKLAAQEFWKRCATSGDIYKKNYRIKYCVGCELEKTESELADGRCPVHPNLELQVIEEENYFFRLSGYQKKLLAFYDANPDFVVPAFRLNEIRSLIKEKGLEDFSISRLKSKMPWGVSVPDDNDHVMYVWFDALVNYISAIGWPDHLAQFEKWWPVTQFAGKDQVRQQAVMWQAMLLSAGLPPSKQIVIHGFIQSGGQKMSKSLGNVIDPLALVQEYGTDALRFYLARHVHPFEDSDFTVEKFKEAYNADLANGIGNLTSRIMKMATDHLSTPVSDPNPGSPLPFGFTQHLDTFNIQAATSFLTEWVTSLDQKIQETEPFKLVKQDKEKGKAIIIELVKDLFAATRMFEPILPETAAKIQTLIAGNNMPSAPLFPRK
ncbi:MAG: methionine--tRNA ligase [Candidatus Taylorbacteria bacterium]|nr:methionine--tRNA ligase [Candidatus Taylorbacteria bacterium]